MVMSQDNPLRLGVVTLGLIGGSIALAAQQTGVEVYTWDRNEKTRKLAREQGIWVDDELETLAARDLDILMVASPLFAMSDIFARIAKVVPESTTVTDAGSVKERVREGVAAAGLLSQYVGAHPMAGTEKSGFVHAFPDLFTGATWGLTLDDSTEFERAKTLLTFITRVMDGRVLVTDDRTHDDSVALVSHLPHVLSHTLTSVVAGAPQSDVALCLAAGSFRDGTRVARGSAVRNQAMVADNPRAVREAVKEAIGRLQNVYAALEDPVQNSAALTDFFESGTLVVEAGRSEGEAVTCVARELSIHRRTWRRDLLGIGAQGLRITNVFEISGHTDTFVVEAQ